MPTPIETFAGAVADVASAVTEGSSADELLEALGSEGIEAFTQIAGALRDAQERRGGSENVAARGRSGSLAARSSGVLHPFIAKVKAAAHERGITVLAANRAVRSEYPTLFRDYIKSGGSYAA